MVKSRLRAAGLAAAMTRRGAGLAAVMTRCGAALAVGGLLTLATAGCAGQVTGTAAADAPSDPPVAAVPEPRSPGPMLIHPRWRSCAGEASVRDSADSEDTSALGRLTDTFRPVAAVVCKEAVQRRPDGGMDATAVEDRTGDVTALAAALRLPDEPPPTGPSADDEPPATACTADLVLPPRLVLLDAQGRWVRPGVPVDACGKPRTEFTAAMQKPTWTRISTRVLHEVESARAAASGCDDAYADMVWVAGLDPPTRHADLAPLAERTGPARLCVYRVEPSEQGSDKPRGDLVSGGLLPPGRWAAVRREIQTAGPTTACATPASRFALLDSPQGVLSVELDGCRRFLAPAVDPGDGTSFDTLRQGSAALAELLTEP